MSEQVSWLAVVGMVLLGSGVATAALLVVTRLVMALARLCLGIEEGGDDEGNGD